MDVNLSFLEYLTRMYFKLTWIRCQHVSQGKLTVVRIAALGPRLTEYFCLRTIRLDVYIFLPPRQCPAHVPTSVFGVQNGLPRLPGPPVTPALGMSCLLAQQQAGASKLNSQEVILCLTEASQPRLPQTLAYLELPSWQGSRAKYL